MPTIYRTTTRFKPLALPYCLFTIELKIKIKTKIGATALRAPTNKFPKISAKATTFIKNEVCSAAISPAAERAAKPKIAPIIKPVTMRRTRFLSL